MELMYAAICFCRTCSEPLLNSWKGWPLKDRIPALPIIENDKCPTCGSTNLLFSSQIEWINVHGEGNTGLPDYWKLLITNRIGNFDQLPAHWGFPYFGLDVCPLCGSTIIVSQHQGNHSQEFVGQCTSCDYFSRVHQSRISSR